MKTKSGPNLDLQQIFDAAPGSFLVLAPDVPRFTILAVTDAYLEATKTRRSEVLSKGVFEVFPDNPDDPEIKAVEYARASFTRVVKERHVDVMGVRQHDIRRPESEGGGFEKRFWDAVNFPVFGTDGQVSFIIHRVEDVTESQRLKQKEVDQQAAAVELRDSRRAALNMMEDAIAARRQAEEVSEKLRQSEERLGLATSATRIGMFDWDLASNTVLWTETHEAIFGYTPAPTTATTTTVGATVKHDYRGWADRVHPDDLPIAEEEARRCMLERKPLEMQCRIIWPDGSLHWIETRAVYLYDSYGKADRMLGAVMDITERKRAEERVEQTYGRLKTFFDARIGGIGIVIARADGSVLQANDFYLDILGYTRQEFEAGKVKWIERTPPEWIPADERALAQLRDRGACDPYEKEYIRRNGTRVPVLITDVMMPGPENDILAIVVNMTERKRADEALKAARDSLELRVEERTRELQQAYYRLKEETEERGRLEEQLRQSQKMEAIGTLAGGIAHDFNNILAAILGFTEMAVEDVADRPEVEENLKKVLQSAMRARDLVKQILAFSRKTNYARGPMSLSPLINETVQLLRASIPTTIEIKLAIDTNWDRINAAPVEVQQVLMNLATNAALAMQERGGTLEIGLTDIDFTPDSPVLEPDVMPGEYLQLLVKDTGIGMGPDVMKHVFEPFFTTREVGKGSGMGLAVVYGIVKDLRGTITVESTRGVGSTFRVLFPKIQAEIEKEQTRPAHSPRGTEKILFVDDEEMLREWGEAALSRLGYTVTTMADSAEALKVFCSDPARFDLVITDQTMPSMTGIQFARELLKVRPDIPIILCTGHSEAVSPDGVKEAGIREYLMKPLARQELAATVRQVLDG